MEIIEKFIEGKKEDFSLCEDGIFVSRNFVAVVDGVTSKGEKIFGNVTGGKASAQKVIETLAGFPANISCRSAVDELSQAVKALYADGNPTGEAAASVIIYSDFHKEIWSIGDCQCIINGDAHLHEKEIDKINAEFRALVLQIEKQKGIADAELLQCDTGRKLIMPALEGQHIFANKTGKYSYGIINGTQVPDCHIAIHKVACGDEVVLSSDGYPHLKNTLRESEELLKKELSENPLCIEGYVSTKGLAEGNRSFDDRAYIKFKV